MRLVFFGPSDPFEMSFFRVIRWILRFLGLWPMDPFPRSTQIKVFINLGILLTAIIGEFRMTWLIRSEPVEALDAVSPCLTKVVTWLKLLCFVIYRKELAQLLDQLFRHLAKDAKDTRKNAIIRRISFFTVGWSLWLYFFGISTDSFYVTKPLIIWTYQRYIGRNDTWIGLPFQAALPFQDMTDLNNKFLYSIMYCFLAYSGVVTIFGFPATDGAFMCFCMYLSVSYQCLQEDFKQAFQNYINSGCMKDGPFYEVLSRLVRRQQDIIVMFTRFERIYKYMIFGHFLFAAIVLGVVLVDLLLTPGVARTIYVTYAMGACTQLYTYCYGAEKVDESCSKLAETLYFCDWYKCDQRTKKLILFIMVKAQRGNSLSAPFFTPSIPLFANIIKTSGSYITLLKTFL